MKRHTLIGCFASVLSLSTWSHGQAVPTAARGGSIQVGLGGMITNPDYAQSYIKGVTFYGDFDFTHNIGIEGEMNFAISTPSDISEDSYLFGPRYTIHRKKFGGYAKLLLGVGRFGTQEGSYVNIATTSYFEYAFGGGVEYMPPATSTFGSSTSNSRNGPGSLRTAFHRLPTPSVSPMSSTNPVRSMID